MGVQIYNNLSEHFIILSCFQKNPVLMAHMAILGCLGWFLHGYKRETISVEQSLVA